MSKTIAWAEGTFTNMTEPFTVMLTNEVQQFATDSNRKVTSAQSYYTDIIVIRGSQERTDYTIGNITSGSGITVSKSSKRVTFSVSAGVTIGADAGVIEIPITLDGQTVKKQFSWSCGKQGPQGAKGNPGTSVKITSKSVTYQASTSGTTAPTGTWSTTVPTVNNGQYLWTKTTVQYSDGNKTEAYSVSYKGTNGTNGTSVTVSKTEVTYQVSTSGTTAPTGTWSTTMPTCDQGQYLWTKTYVKYSDGKDTTSYSVSYKGADGKKFAFNMLRGTNQGNKHWTNIGASGKYSVESITTDDNINAAKLICTEAIASNEWQFCSFKDYEMLKSLKALTTYVLSYDIKTNRSGTILHNIKTGGGQKVFFSNNISCKVLGNETWEHISITMTTSSTLPSLDGQVVYMFGNALLKVGYSIIKNLKLTEGTADTPWAPHPEDLEGRGVTETVQYYLATSQASGVTSSTSGWSTNITTQKITADKKYLWNCYQTKYSDGTSEPISTPKVIGVYGDKGANALQCKRNWTGTYTTINGTAVATLSDFNRTPVAGDVFTVLDGSSNTGTWQVISVSGSNVNIKLLSYVNSKGDNAKNLSITPSSQYFKSTDGGKTFAPNTITIKPTLQGEISFGKWQYSIDGGVSFADVVSGQKGLTISNNVLTVSKDSSLYSDAVTMVTFRAVASDSSFYDTCSIAKLYDVTDIGDGRNLLWNSNFAKTDEAITTSAYTTWGLVLRGNTYTATIDTSVKHNNFNTLKVIGTKADENSGQDLIYRIKGLDLNEVKFTTTGTKYTLSFYAKASTACNFSVRYAYDSYTKDTNAALGTDWKRYKIQMHPTTTSYQTALIFKMDAASTVWFSEFKLEKGSSATGYSTAPEDVQTAILSTKSEISSVSSKVDQNTKSIENRVEKTTYQNDLKLVKGDINKANEGLNKWRYEIYPKSLFASEYQGKSTMDVFAKNTNLTPSQSVLINDTDFGKNWAYGDNYIGYALTFVKFSAAKSVAITFKHDDGAHLYLNGKLIGGSDGCNTGSGHNLSLSFVKGWNCLEVVLNEITGGEYIGFGTTISALTECELMNCYYAMVTGRESQITNTLVQTVTDLSGVTTTVGKVTGVIGEDGGKFTEFKNDYSNFKQSMDGFKTTVSSTYVTKNDFDNLEIGGRNLLLYSQDPKGHTDYYHSLGYISLESEIFGGSPVWSTKSQWGRLGWNFKNHVIDRGFVNVGDTFTYSLYVKTNNTDGKNISCSYRFQGNSGAKWFDGSTTTVTTSWRQISATFSITEAMLDSTAYLNQIGFEVTSSMSSDDKVYFACPKLEKGNKATDWTPAPEDVDTSINKVETVATQTAEKFNWIVKSGTSSTDFTLTDRTATLVADAINLNGLVTFNGLNSDARKKIDDIDTKAGNAQNTANGAQEDINNLEVGGRNLWVLHDLKAGYENAGDIIGSSSCHQTRNTLIDVTPGSILTCQLWNPNKVNNTSNTNRIAWFTSDKTYISSVTTIKLTGETYKIGTVTVPSNAYFARLGMICGASTYDETIKIKIEKGNKATDWTPAPEDVSQDATNKASQALTDAKNYSSNAVNWVISNGSSTTSLNSMVKKWTDGAVSDTTQINGGWIKANTITASKIAVGDFTNYCQLNKDTASYYGFTATDDKDGIWYTADPIKRDKEISQWFTCEDSQKLYVEYDISTTVQGKVNSSDTDNSYLHSGIMIFAADGNKKVISYIRTKDATAAADGIVTHISVTETLPTGARFFKVFLQTNGQNGSFSGVLKIRNLQVRKATTGKLIVDGAITADKINVSDLFAKNIVASGTIQSENYAESNGSATAGSKWILSDGSFKSKNLSWDASGNITAAGGKIGKYTITDSYLITGSGATASGFGGNQAFWAGSSSSNDAPFRVGYNGKLYASGATISGDITATTGKIGDLTLKDGILTGTGSYSEPYTKDDDGTVTSTITTNYITKLFGKGLTIDSTVKYSDEDDIYSYKASVLPDEISFTDGEEIGMLGAGGLRIFQVNDNSDSYSSEANEVSLSSGASNFYYTTPVNQTTDKYLHVCFSADGASFMASQGDKVNTFDIGYSSAKYSGNFAANKFVYTGNSLNYIECLDVNDTTNVYFHSSGYYSFRVNNLKNWSNETQSVYITERGVSVPGQIGLYSQEMSNYVARYYVAGSTKSTAIGNNSYQTRIYGSSVWANKAVSTSDVRLKKDFQTLDKFEDLYMNLQPVSFKYIDGYDKSEDRYFGLKAQPTEKLFEDMGENPDDYAMFNKFGIDHEDIKERIGHDVDFDEEHGLDYTNMIALNTHMVQKTRRELEQLERENAELKATLKAIIQKLNMQQN